MRDQREYMKAYYAKNRDRIKARSKAYFIANKERILTSNHDRYLANRSAILKRQAAYNLENRERKRIYCKQWRERNSERVKAKKKAYYEANKKQRLEYLKRYKRNTPAYTRAYVMRRRAKLKNACSEKVTANDIRELYRTHPCCAYCGKRLNKRSRTLDHITPLSRGGIHALSNLIPACRPCNTKKGSKLLAIKTAMPQKENGRK